MTIDEAQKIVDEWINTLGVRYFNELTNMALLTEEVGELARIIARKYGEQSFKESDKQYNLADEMADVLFESKAISFLRVASSNSSVTLKSSPCACSTSFFLSVRSSSAFRYSDLEYSAFSSHSFDKLVVSAARQNAVADAIYKAAEYYTVIITHIVKNGKIYSYIIFILCFINKSAKRLKVGKLSLRSFADTNCIKV